MFHWHHFLLWPESFLSHSSLMYSLPTLISGKQLLNFSFSDGTNWLGPIVDGSGPPNPATLHQERRGLRWKE